MYFHHKYPNLSEIELEGNETKEEIIDGINRILTRFNSIIETQGLDSFAYVNMTHEQREYLGIELGEKVFYNVDFPESFNHIVDYNGQIGHTKSYDTIIGSLTTISIGILRYTR